MTRARYQYARRRAAEVLRDHHAGGYHVDPMDIARRLGVTVLPRTLHNRTSGLLVVKDGRAAIVYNEAHHPNRQRFSVAHEVGHFILHAARQGTFEDTETYGRGELASRGTDPVEIEANTFAAELLMPPDRVKDAFRNLWFEESHADRIDEMSSLFGVSATAMTIRLERLGLLDPLYEG